MRKKLYVLVLLGFFLMLVFFVYDKYVIKITEKDFEIKGISMQPMLKDGGVIKVKMDYYNGGKNDLKSGDVIIFENPFTKEKVIKKLSIIPGDKVEINKKDGTIKINGKLFKNSIGDIYKFKKHELKWFEIYMQNGVMVENNYFIFGDNVSNSIDSRIYGPISKEGILGKVILN